METYTFLRELADSWMLLLLTLFFLGTIVWAFRPGSRDIHREAGDIPFRYDQIDAGDAGQTDEPAQSKKTEGAQ